MELFLEKDLKRKRNSRNGSIYIVNVSYLIETNQIISDTPLLIEMSKSDSINVDTLEDLYFLQERLCK